MVKLTGINSTNYMGDGVDRSKWKFDRDGVDRERWRFDEHGFDKAITAALETVRRECILRAEEENMKTVRENNPSTVDRSIDGVDGASDDAFKL